MNDTGPLRGTPREYKAWLRACGLNHRKRTDPVFVRTQYLDPETCDAVAPGPGEYEACRFFRGHRSAHSWELGRKVDEDHVAAG